MATRFTQIVAAIKTQLDADWPGNTVTFTEGVKARSENTSPNEVTWVRVGGRANPSDGAGPGRHDSEVSPGTEVASTPILTDSYDVEADVWGESEEAADEIRIAIIRAGYKAASNRSIEVGGWRDLTEVPDDAAYQTYGAAHRVEFVFNVPIMSERTETDLALVLTTPVTEGFVTSETFATTIANQLDLDSGPP